jgi:hypothetical protein
MITVLLAMEEIQNADIREANRVLRKDSWIQSLRLHSLCILLVVAYVVATTVYASFRESEQKAFENSMQGLNEESGLILLYQSSYRSASTLKIGKSISIGL